jgi:hypothetical protein
MLLNVGLSKDFWVEAVNTYCYLVNHTQLLIVKILIKYCMLLQLIIQIGISWREHIACFRMWGCLRIFGLRLSIHIAIWSTIHSY